MIFRYDRKRRANKNVSMYNNKMSNDKDINLQDQLTAAGLIS